MRRAHTTKLHGLPIAGLAAVQQVTPLHTGYDTETAPTLATLHHRRS